MRITLASLAKDERMECGEILSVSEKWSLRTIPELKSGFRSTARTLEK
jgi:hypothetical protein